MRRHITNRWFYSCPPWYAKIIGIYVWGDALIVVPLIIMITCLSVYDMSLGITAILVTWGVRALGEMVYWIHQQFGSRTYRPYDFGLRSLDNHAIYILYQLSAMAQLATALSALVIMMR